MKILHMVTFWLVVIGAVNWGLSALGYNVVDMVLGAGSTIGMVVYLAVGASGLYLVYDHMQTCKYCKGEMKTGM